MESGSADSFWHSWYIINKMQEVEKNMYTMTQGSMLIYRPQKTRDCQDRDHEESG